MAGIYLHIPFCVRKCAYCDFVSFPQGSVPEAYVSALISEIERVSGGGSYPAAFDTVFFGGGTPSLLTGGQMRRIMTLLRERFDIRANAEISMEANPGTLTQDKLADYREAGINRLSIGLQSTHDALLREIGRILTPVRVANLCWGGADGQTLYMCATDKLLSIRTTTTDATWARRA